MPDIANVANSCLNVVARKDVESDVNARKLSCHAQPSVFCDGDCSSDALHKSYLEWPTV